MRLEDLQAFLHFAELGNLGRAAVALSLTSSALSKTLTRREAATGISLVERTGTGVVLTSAGHSLREHATRVTLAMADLNGEMAEQRHARSGMVRVGVLPFLMSSPLSPVLARFIASRPLAQFHIDTQLSARVMDLLQRGELDLALVARPDHIPAGLEFHPLVPMQLRVVLREWHPRREKLHTLADLSGERWALPTATPYLRNWLDQRFIAANLPLIRVAVEGTGAPAIFDELLRHSDLLGVMPLPLVQQAEGERLMTLPGDALLWERKLAMFWRSEGHLSPVCRDFRDAVMERA